MGPWLQALTVFRNLPASLVFLVVESTCVLPWADSSSDLMDGETVVLTDEGCKPIAGYHCYNAVGETTAHPGPLYSHHLILNTSLPWI